MTVLKHNKSEVRPPRRQSHADARESLRDTLWPEADGKTWHRLSNQGFTTVPRLLGLVLVLIKKLSGPAGDASRVYLDLWLRAFDEGFVNVIDDEELAYSSGYTGSRAARSWRERVFTLSELGFIDVKARGNTEVGYVLIWNPLRVCAQLHADGKVDTEWWTSFVGRALDIGAAIPSVKATLPRKPK